MIRLIASLLLCAVFFAVYLSLRGADSARPGSVPGTAPSELPPSALLVSKNPAKYTTLVSGYRQAEGKQLYKWRDTAGIINLGTEPPPPGVPVQVYHYELAFDQDSRPAPVPSQGSTPVDAEEIPSNPLMVYTPAGLRELMNYTARVGEQLREREELMSELSAELQ